MKGREVGISYRLRSVIRRRLAYPSLSLLDPMSAPISAYAIAGLSVHQNWHWLLFLTLAAITNWLFFKSAALGLSAQSHREWMEMVTKLTPTELAIERISNRYGQDAHVWEIANSFCFDFIFKVKGRLFPIDREAVVFAPTEEGPLLASAKSYPSVFGMNVIILDTSMFDHDIGPNFTLHHEFGHVSNAGILASIHDFGEGDYFFWIMVCVMLASAGFWVGAAAFLLLIVRTMYFRMATQRAYPEAVADVHAIWHLPIQYAEKWQEAVFHNWDRHLNSGTCTRSEANVIGLRARTMRMMLQFKKSGRSVFNDPRRLRLGTTLVTAGCMVYLGIHTKAEPTWAIWMIAFIVLMGLGSVHTYRKQLLSVHDSANLLLRPFSEAFAEVQKSPRYLHLFESGRRMYIHQQSRTTEDYLMWLDFIARSPHRTAYEKRVLDEHFAAGLLPPSIPWPPISEDRRVDDV